MHRHEWDTSDKQILARCTSRFNGSVSCFGSAFHAAGVSTGSASTGSTFINAYASQVRLSLSF